MKFPRPTIQRLLLWAAAILAAALAVPLIIALFIPTRFVVERSVTIAKPRGEVYDYLRHLKNQHHYSKWFLTDPQARWSYQGEDGAEGFLLGWDSDHPDLGQGEQEITRLVPNERIDVDIRFVRPFRSTDPAYMTTTALDGEQTQVTFGYRGKMPYPFNLFCRSVQRMIGDDLATNGENLRQILENN